VNYTFKEMEIITAIKEMKHLQFCGGESQGNTSIVNERRTKRTKMIGMDFISFIILLVISIVVSGVLHFVIKFYVRPGMVVICLRSPHRMGRGMVRFPGIRLLVARLKL
jgi:hypothetical protein